MTPKPSNTIPIVIKVSGFAASTDAALAPLIESILKTTRHHFTAMGRSGFQHKCVSVSSLGYDDDRIAFPSGLVNSVQNHLEDEGYTVHVDDPLREGHLENVDHRVLSDPTLDIPIREFYEVLSQSPFGQILFHQKSEVAPLIALMARLYHRYNIFVIASNTSERDRLVKEIAKNCDRPVKASQYDVSVQIPHVLVTTLEFARRVGIDEYQIIIHADTESATSIACESLSSRWNNATWYAFVDAHAQLRDNERFRLLEFFGPVISVPGEPAPKMDVSVLFHAGPHTKTQQQESALERKRYFYWNNVEWNENVAQLAKQITRHGLPDSVPDSHIRMETTDVSILVESEEHGRALRQLLPGWALRTMHSRIKKSSPCATASQITTMTYANEYGINADVVIRADGGPGWPLGEALTHAAIDVLLMDFEDGRDKQAARETRARKAAYERQNWDIIKSNAAVETTASQRQQADMSVA